MALPADFEHYQKDVRNFAKNVNSLKASVKEGLLNQHSAYLRDSKSRNSYLKIIEFSFMDQVSSMSDPEKYKQLKTLLSQE